MFHNKPTDLRIGITNPAVMRIGNRGRNSKGVTYFACDIIQTHDTIFWATVFQKIVSHTFF